MIFQFSKKTFGHFLKIRGPKLFIIRQKYFEPKIFLDMDFERVAK